MQALVSPGSGKDATVQRKLIPTFKDHEVLVKTKAVALNPTDWFHLRNVSPEGAIMGCDFAGVVSKVGAKVKDIQVGDRVAGGLYGNASPEIGSFAEYLKADAAFLWKVPSNVNDKEAAAIGGLGSEVAAFSLYSGLGLPLPGKDSSNKMLLVWSGASSIGMYAIQLAKASGLRVITTASPENHEYLKSLGAEECFDYKDSEVVNKIKSWCGENQITTAVDCASQQGSTKLAAQCMSGGKIVALRPTDANAEGISHVEIKNILLPIGYTIKVFGQEVPSNPEDEKARSAFAKNYLPQLVESGQLKPNPMKELKGGLDCLVDGMKYMEKGQVKMQKLVYAL